MAPVGSSGRSLMASGYWNRQDTGGGDGGGGDDGGSDGGSTEYVAPERFYNDENPPQRSGTTYTYPDDFSGSIQNAIHSLNSGEELYITPGTYSQTVLIDSSVSDNITVRSDLELSFDADGNSTVVQEGATLEGSPPVFETDQQFFGTDAEIASPIAEGDTVIDVTDASPFSAGDTVAIVENTRPWQVEQAGGGSGASETRELAEVESVDTTSTPNTITLEYGTRQPFPDINSNRVTVYDFTVEDFRLSGIRFRGDTTVDTSPLMLQSVKNGWFDNVVVEDVGDQPLILLKSSYRCRFDGYRVQNGSAYGLNSTAMSTDTMVTNASGYNHSRYVVRLGPTSNSASGLYADGVYGEVNGRTTINCHDGGYHYEAHNVVAQDCQIATPRSRYFTLEGFEKRGTTGADFVLAQLPTNVTVRDGTIANKTTGDSVFGFRMRSAENTPHGTNGDERFDNVLFEDIDIEEYGTPATDIGYFEVEGSPEPSGTLTFKNVTLGGTPITKSDVESWSGYDPSLMDLEVINNDTDELSQYYTDGPPTRSGDTIVYDGNSHSSLQDAYDSLQSGDTLELDSSNSPYVERLDFAGKTSVTITSTDTTNPAQIREPDTNLDHAVYSSGYSRSADTTLQASIAGGGTIEDGNTDDEGDTVISVNDASPFSIGDDIYIHEDYRPFGEANDIGGASGPSFTREMREVVDVDTSSTPNTITVHYPMFMPFPSTNSTEVGIVDWVAEDIHFTGVDIRGSSSSSPNGRYPLRVQGVRDGWFDNMRVTNADDTAIRTYDTMHCRFDNMEVANGNGYGINVNSSQHTLCTDILGEDITNYVVRGGNCATDIRIDGMEGRNFRSDGPVAATHWGAFYVNYASDIYANNEQLVRFRTRHMTVNDFRGHGSSVTEVSFGQRPYNVALTNGHIGNYPSDANNYIFYFRLRSDSHNERAENVRFENIEIDQLDNKGPGEIGTFDAYCEIDGLHIKDVYYNGTKLTRSDVENWNRYGDSTTNITNLTVE